MVVNAMTLMMMVMVIMNLFYKVIIIAQQIAQGMGYLHHKGIIHKVKSKH